MTLKIWQTEALMHVDLNSNFIYACQPFDAVIGATGSHATWAAFFADGNIANLRDILVLDVFTSEILIPSGYNGKRYTFKRGAGCNPTTGNAMRIQSSGNEVIGFTAITGSCGIYLESTALNNTIINLKSFNAVTTEFIDMDTTNTNIIIGKNRGVI